MAATILRDTNRTLPTGGFRGTLRQFVAQLSRRRKRQLALLLMLMLAGAAAELLTLGAVIPFVGVLANPDSVAAQTSMARIMAATGVGIEDLPVVITVIFATLVASAMVVRLTLIWANIRFANGLGAEISETLYARTLQRPYMFHVSQNTSRVIGSINKVQRLITGYLQPMLTGVSATIVGLAITGLLIVVNPVVAIGGASIFTMCYLAVALLARHRLVQGSRIIARTSDQRLQALQEGLGGIRDVILDRAHLVFRNRFARIEQRYRRAQASSQFIAASPRIAIETIAFVMLMGFAMVFAGRDGDFISLLPMLGAFTVGVAKLMPLLQQIYGSWSTVTSSQRSVHDVLALLEFEPDLGDPTPITFQDAISLGNVRFRYGEEGPEILKGINFNIRRGEKVGIEGATGSGKSTFVDMLMGLLSPTSGEFAIDGVTIDSRNAASWQRHIAHVPQAIYLSDASIAENIAFAVEPGCIDQAQVRMAAEAAQIHSHIEGLPDGYATMVGERGVRLSGGQRQRIGIARALYKQADVLVLDEATSALDDETERKVIAGISAISADTTIIMIAHRLTTMSNCNRIAHMDGGCITKVQTYAELMAATSAVAKDAAN
jgi:ABC-type multidrug transport system fused ATPase/permease subunit